VSLLGLLDLSAVVDCVDHGILLLRLERDLGITDTALDWIRSFLTMRTQQVFFIEFCLLSVHYHLDDLVYHRDRS
jgi:hypothetical protein